ncbi:ribonuclease D [Kiloniella laminariae]|uniref:ribonuclease D n=1 Tax=Kiloniella laminariae TaxID=454162 RepID=UPI000382CC3D|nr:ribonuclease D [Kiloniella laminariae]
MTLITSSQELSDLCKELAKSEVITVDTEFLRDQTYWPKLCLVQLADANHFAAVDVLAPDIELEPLYDLMRNSAVLKVFHSARQDLEIFYLLMDEVPQPLFDTQLAAMVCGFGDSIGYDNLARQLINQEIDKSARFADWSRRPLTPKQISYALSDVTHLRDIYAKLREQIDKSGREHWLREEMAILENPQTYQQDPDRSWLRLKTRSNDRRYLAILKELAAWREREAQRRNTPRSRVIKDEQLYDIASNRPTTAKDLAKTRGVSPDMADGRLGREILAAIEIAMQLPKADCPAPKERPPHNNGLAAIVDLLKVLLKQCCDEYDVAQKLIANGSDLELIASDDTADVPALSGWRREVFGEKALRLKQGLVALSIKDGKLVVEDLG